MRRESLAALFIVVAATAGCGYNDDEAARTDSETDVDSSEPTIVARATLRAGDLSPGAFTGSEAVNVELARAADSSFTLIVESDWEPHTIVIATSTCEAYAESRDAGEKLYEVTGLPGDSVHGGNVAERHELPLDKDTAATVLAAVPVTAFGDSGGAHGGEYIYCGTLETTDRR